MKRYVTSMFAIVLVALVAGCSGDPATNTVLAQTSLTMTRSAETEGATVVVATLKDDNGLPIGSVPVTFSDPTCIGSVGLPVSVKTNTNGVASMTLTDVPGTVRHVVATFDGASNFEKSEATLVIEWPSVLTSSDKINASNPQLSVGDKPLIAPEDGLITLNSLLLLMMLFSFVVGCVWTMVRVRGLPAFRTM